MLVVKVGGARGVDRQAVCTDLAALAAGGQRWVLVHGGSHETNLLAEQLGYPPRFITSVSGYTSRYTDPRTMEIFQMVYCGKVNKEIVTTLQQQQVQAVGLSGVDGRLLEGKRKGALKIRENDRTMVIRDDLSGKVEKVNSTLLTSLLDDGYYPVVCPPAISTEGVAINVDGDRAAAKIAAALQAETLVILSDVPGVLRSFPDPSTLIRRLTVPEVADVVERHAQGRMRIKLLGAVEAIEAGVQKVILAQAGGDTPVQTALEGQGTTIVKEDAP